MRQPRRATKNTSLGSRALTRSIHFQGDLGESLGFKVVLVHEDDWNGTAHLHQEEGSHFWHVLKAVADKAARAAAAQKAAATETGAAAAAAPPPTPTQTI